MKRSDKRRARSFLVGILSLMLSVVLFLHICQRSYQKNEVDLVLVVVARELFREQSEALVGEEVLFLDGRFPLSVLQYVRTPSVLRFYDGEAQCEFTTPSGKYSDYEITLLSSAREHSFGFAIGGLRTVTVGTGITLYGERCKVYGTVSSLTATHRGEGKNPPF